MAGPRLWRHTPCNPCQRANGVPQEPSFAASASSLAGIGVWRVLQTFHSEVQSIGERKMEMWRQEIFHVSTSPLALKRPDCRLSGPSSVLPLRGKICLSRLYANFIVGRRSEYE